MLHDLTRFITAQAPHLDNVRAELTAGEKRTHWMWFIFPQLTALGRSPMAEHFGIADLAEARAYLADPVLGPRLIEMTGIVNAVRGRTAHQIFGAPDDLKFRSSMTLFAQADPDETAFRQALAKYYAAEPDPRTLEVLRA